MATNSECIELAVDQYLRSKLQTGELFDWAVGQFVSFVGANFAGVLPVDDDSLEGLLPGDASQLRPFAVSALSFGLNVPFFAVRSIEKLWLSKRALFDVLSFDGIDQQQRLFDVELWRFRLIAVWSSILLEKEIQLKKLSEERIRSLDSLFSALSMSNERRAEFTLEKVCHHLRYSDSSAASKALDEALVLVGIEKMEFGGALGLRTRYQNKAVSQLVLKVTLSSPEANGSDASPTERPKNCASNDDTLLESVVFSDINEHIALSPIQCACVLNKALFERHTNPTGDKLGTEFTMAYLEEVISQKCCSWAVQFHALFERSLLEQQNSRRVERACAQLESLCKLLDDDPSTPAVSHRMDLLFCSFPTPFWTVLKSHAKVLLSLGCVSDSLRIFERLQLWDESVQCFLSLRQPQKAEALVRRLLAQKKEQPLYLCLLGDITNDAECYRKAIKISDDKSFRARFSLAQHLLNGKHFNEAMEHYARSVQIQPLQLTAWFNFGFVAMKCGDFRTASKAFHRCVNIDPAHFEAWNNLAASYIQLGKKDNAQKILLEALKLKWDNVHLLDNLLLISIDIDDHKKAIWAIEKQIEIGKKEIDELALGALSVKILSLEEADGTLHSLMALFARINAKQSLSPKLLRIYAHLKRPTDEQSEDIAALSTHAQLLEKAFQREYCQPGQAANFCTDQKICAKMLNDLLEVVNALQNTWRIQKLGHDQIRAKVQLRVGPTIALLERNFGPNCERADDPNLLSHLKRVNELLG